MLGQNLHFILPGWEFLYNKHHLFRSAWSTERPFRGKVQFLLMVFVLQGGRHISAEDVVEILVFHLEVWFLHSMLPLSYSDGDCEKCVWDESQRIPLTSSFDFCRVSWDMLTCHMVITLKEIQRQNPSSPLSSPAEKMLNVVVSVRMEVKFHSPSWPSHQGLILFEILLATTKCKKGKKMLRRKVRRKVRWRSVSHSHWHLNNEPSGYFQGLQ